LAVLSCLDCPIRCCPVDVLNVVTACRRRSTASSQLFLPRTLEALLTPQKAAVLEHVARLWVHLPVTAFARLISRPRYLSTHSQNDDTLWYTDNNLKPRKTHDGIENGKPTRDFQRTDRDSVNVDCTVLVGQRDGMLTPCNNHYKPNDV